MGIQKQDLNLRSSDYKSDVLSSCTILNLLQYLQYWQCILTLIREAVFKVFVLQALCLYIQISMKVVALDTFIWVSSSVRSVSLFSVRAATFSFTLRGSTSSVVFSFT